MRIIVTGQMWVVLAVGVLLGVTAPTAAAQDTASVTNFRGQLGAQTATASPLPFMTTFASQAPCPGSESCVGPLQVELTSVKRAVWTTRSVPFRTHHTATALPLLSVATLGPPPTETVTGADQMPCATTLPGVAA